MTSAGIKLFWLKKESAIFLQNSHSNFPPITHSDQYFQECRMAGDDFLKWRGGTEFDPNFSKKSTNNLIMDQPSPVVADLGPAQPQILLPISWNLWFNQSIIWFSLFFLRLRDLIENEMLTLHQKPWTQFSLASLCLFSKTVEISVLRSKKHIYYCKVLLSVTSGGCIIHQCVILSGHPVQCKTVKGSLWRNIQTPNSSKL